MDSVFSRLQRPQSRCKASFLLERDRDAVTTYLSQSSRLNLQLLDLADSVGRRDPRPPSEPVIVVAWQGSEVAGVASLRPSLIVDAEASTCALECIVPFLVPIETGLVKSHEEVVTSLWSLLQSRGRHSLIDRSEIAFAIEPRDCPPPFTDSDMAYRRACEEDLDALVYAARASLREEGRPDPSAVDPAGFRRWVSGRIGQARIVEYRGDVSFVGYADVRRKEGWLIQGVFTWPEVRRRGVAAAGMAGLVREAFESGCDHVQLSVVAGNEAALGLYRGLGFRPFTRLRTVLFV